MNQTFNNAWVFEADAFFNFLIKEYKRYNLIVIQCSKPYDFTTSGKIIGEVTNIETKETYFSDDLTKIKTKDGILLKDLGNYEEKIKYFYDERLKIKNAWYEIGYDSIEGDMIKDSKSLSTSIDSGGQFVGRLRCLKCGEIIERTNLLKVQKIDYHICGQPPLKKYIKLTQPNDINKAMVESIKNCKASYDEWMVGISLINKGFKIEVTNHYDFNNETCFFQYKVPNSLLVCDFFIPSQNKAIEIQGKEHFYGDNFNKNKDHKSVLFEQLSRDMTKYQKMNGQIVYFIGKNNIFNE